LLRGTDFGNVFSRALANTRGLPLLNLGRRFHRTDVVIKLAPG
jgi:uncharacterized protein with PIN domain